MTHECDFPPQARALPALTSSALPASANAAEIDRHVRRGIHEGSSIYHLDDALVERLEPDLIVTQELCEVCAVSYDRVTSAVRRLRGDPRVVALEPNSFDDVLGTIRTLGSLVGRASEAERVVEDLARSAERLRSRARRELPDPPRLLFLEWSDPPFAPGHWTPDLLDMLGVRSTIEFRHAPARAVTWEEVAAGDPDCIVLAPCGFDLATARRALADLRSNAAWCELRAVRNGHTIVLDGNAYFNRPGVRLVEGTERLLEELTRLEDGRYRRA